MTDTGGGLDDITRRVVLNAALKELGISSVGSFTLDGVAARARVEVRLVKQAWPSAPELFREVLEEFADSQMPVPDTGTLRDDLLQYARSFARMANTPDGRRILDALIVKPEDWDLSDSRAVVLQYRSSRVSAMVQRAVERGECPAGTDPALALDMLVISLCLPVLVYDRPVSDEHCRDVVRTLLNGITGKG